MANTLQSKRKSPRSHSTQTNKKQATAEDVLAGVEVDAQQFIQGRKSVDSNRRNTGRRSESQGQHESNIDDNLMTIYKPLLKQKGDEFYVTDAQEFLRANDFGCTFLGMAKAICKLKHDLVNVQSRMRTDDTIYIQNSIDEKRKHIADFKLFLTQKTCNMFKATFTMVSV